MAENVVEILVKSVDKTKAGFTAAEASAEKSAGVVERIWSKHADAIGEKLKTVGTNTAKGGGLFALGSAALAAAAPLGALGVAVGAFGAVAVPELSKVHDAMTKTGTAGKKAWAQLTPDQQALGNAMKSVEKSFASVQKAVAPVVDKVVGMGARVLKDLMPALGVLAKAGGQALMAFLKPLDTFIKSKTFEQIISQFAKFAVQAGQLLGPVLVQLLKLLLQLFVQLMPSGVQILKILLPLFIQIVTNLVPVIVAVAKVTAAVLNWLSAHKLLKPILLGLLPVLLLLIGSTGIGMVLVAIALLVAGIVALSKNWKKIWAEIKQWGKDAWDFLTHGWGQFLLPGLTLIRLAVAFLRDHWRAIWADIRRIAQDFYNWIWNDFGAKIKRFFTSTIPAWFDILKQSIRITWDDIKIKFLQGADFIMKVMGRLPGPLGAPFRAAHKSIAGDLARIEGDVSSAQRRIQSDWDKLHGKTVNTQFNLVLPTPSGKDTSPGRFTHFAGGGTAGPGWAMVGERGPEMVHMRGGETVVPNHALKGYAGGTDNWRDAFMPSVPSFLGSYNRMFSAAQDSIIAYVRKHAQQVSTFSSGHVPNVGSGVMRWSGLVMQALRMEGLGSYLASQVLYQMMTESGGNPNAINLTDSNARRGDPSRGLLQTIMSTFRAYHWPGTSGNIYDPLANIAAAINYARHTYGPTLMRGGMGMGSGHGYAAGGPASGWNWVGEHGRELVRLPPGSQVYPHGTSEAMSGGGTAAIRLEITGGQGEFDRFLIKWMKEHTRVLGGGNVQLAFGRH